MCAVVEFPISNRFQQKKQALEKEKMDLRSKLESTNNTLHKYREEKSVGMKDRYAKEMKDFIDGLQLKDPEIKNSMHAKMEELAKQGNETGVWEILACASSNHRASVNQIETLTQVISLVYLLFFVSKLTPTINQELNSYKDKERQLQGGLFQSEMSRFQQDTNQIGSAGVKRARAEDSIAGGGAMDNSIMGESNDIWSDFHSMVMRSGGNRGADYSAAVPFGAQPTVPM